MTENDWGEIDSLPPEKSGFPKWILFCGCGCLIPILIMMAGVGWGVNWFATGQDTDVQLERLSEIITFDDEVPDQQLGELFLFFGQRIPFVDVSIFVFFDAEGDPANAEYMCILMHFANLDAADDVTVSRDFGNHTEEVTYTIQGREIVAWRGRDGEMPFPGIPEQGSSGASVVMDLREEGSPLPLICMMMHQGSDEPITEDAVGRLLAPFHIGPDR